MFDGQAMVFWESTSTGRHRSAAAAAALGAGAGALVAYEAALQRGCAVNGCATSDSWPLMASGRMAAVAVCNPSTCLWPQPLLCASDTAVPLHVHMLTASLCQAAWG